MTAQDLLGSFLTFSADQNASSNGLYTKSPALFYCLNGATLLSGGAA